jgi:hypothetical protein
MNNIVINQILNLNLKIIMENNIKVSDSNNN